MLCIAKIASCRTLSPASVQLNKLVAAGEIPDSAYACIAVVYFSIRRFSGAAAASGRLGAQIRNA